MIGAAFVFGEKTVLTLSMNNSGSCMRDCAHMLNLLLSLEVENEKKL